jgi:hypothetical protein
MAGDPGSVLAAFLAGRTARAAPTKGRGRPFGGVEVVGLLDLQKALKDIEPTLKKEFNKELRKLGNKVAAEVRSKVPAKTGRARASVKSGVRNGMAYVQGGKATVPYFAWLDFGGPTREKGPNGPWRNGWKPGRREFIREGRYLYPTVREMQPEILAAAEEAFDRTARKLGLT